jgi:hypothetical protein
MAGYMAVYVDDKSWEKLSKDSDLGPVLKLWEPKPGRSMVLLMSSDSAGTRIAVYFEGLDVAGSVIVSPQSDAKLDPSSIKAVPKEALKEIDAEQGLLFTRGEISSDDGDPVVAYQITSSEKKPNKQ